MYPSELAVLFLVIILFKLAFAFPVELSVNDDVPCTLQKEKGDIYGMDYSPLQAELPPERLHEHYAEHCHKPHIQIELIVLYIAFVQKIDERKRKNGRRYDRHHQHHHR